MVLGKRECLVACVSEGCLVAAGRTGRALREVGHGRALGCCSVAVSYRSVSGTESRPHTRWALSKCL